jgi:LPPG:FO 2-phospho-L-lactate transferase
MHIVVFAGGTGAAKFIRGLTQVVPARDITVVVNTGDDLEWWGLNVSPDLDTICYELAGLLDTERGWGRADETFHCRDAMSALGGPGWFNIGDRDLATHLFRTGQLRAGRTLSSVTADLCSRYRIDSRVLPMTDSPFRTFIAMDDGEIPFQEYFVHRRYSGNVHGVRFEGAEEATPAPGVLDCIATAGLIVIAPSNPVTSVGPILAVPGIATALAQTPARIAAISPMIGTAAFSGPAAQLMAVRELPSSPPGVAIAYREFLDVLIADESDRHLEPEIRKHGVRPHFTDIRIGDIRSAERLARETIDAAAI